MGGIAVEIQTARLSRARTYLQATTALPHPKRDLDVLSTPAFHVLVVGSQLRSTVQRGRVDTRLLTH